MRHGHFASTEIAPDTVSGMRVAIVTETFLPVINGVSNSVMRVVEHLARCGHQPLVVAPGPGPDSYFGAPVVRIPALDLPVVDSVPVGVPTRKVVTALRDFAPDVVHLASPVIVGARGLWAARRLGVAHGGRVSDRHRRVRRLLRAGFRRAHRVALDPAGTQRGRPHARSVHLRSRRPGCPRCATGAPLGAWRGHRAFSSVPARRAPARAVGPAR